MDKTIPENITTVLENIGAACDRTGRDRAEVTLIAVSKTKPLPMLQEAYEYGIRDFGENRVQELVSKAGRLPDDIRWHMIGHLQRNKVKYIVDKVYMIHSVDSLRLAEEISLEAVKKQVTVKILMEVNIAGEASKFGIQDTESAIALVRAVSLLPGIQIRGLMTVAPYTDNSEDNRQYFRNLKQLSVDIMRENIDNVNMNVLSMGMSGDYITAVEEGASHVRVGTGIFGDRIYNSI